MRSLLLLALITGCGSQPSHLQEAWDRINAPQYLTRAYQDSFQALPLKADVGYTPYADSYWPDNRGGLAYRWKVEELGSEITTYSLEELEEFGLGDMRELSPSEKYDLYWSDYSYELTQAEIERTDPELDDWYGLCHGWAAAATHYTEPQSVVIENDEGLIIPFDSTDIKGLMAYTQQLQGIAVKRDLLGLRCMTNLDDAPDQIDSSACKGVNAGSFHIILGNLIGLQKKPVVIDIDRDVEVWNYTLHSYESKILDENAPLYASAAEDTTKIVKIETKAFYSRDIEPTGEPHGNNDVGQHESETYVYFMELNAEGAIVGGEWESFDRPDFMWTQAPANLQTEEWQPLWDIMTKAGVRKI